MYSCTTRIQLQEISLTTLLLTALVHALVFARSTIGRSGKKCDRRLWSDLWFLHDVAA
jgi:hypothetical protein